MDETFLIGKLSIVSPTSSSDRVSDLEVLEDS